MKIAHFSDLHINSAIRDSNINETIALFESALELGAEHFCLTGDLSHNAEPEDFEILRDILIYFNLFNSNKTSIVVGNHDIFGGPQKAEDIFTFPGRCKELNYNKKLKVFSSYFKELTNDCVYTSQNKKYPFAKIINDVLLIGLNSIDKYSSVKNPFASNGSINKEQYDEIEEILKNYGNKVKARMILIHHHFNKINAVSNGMMHYFWQVVEKQTMKLRNKKELLKLFLQHNVDLVMHGHIHECILYKRKGINFINAGGCLNKKKEELSFNMIEINNEGINTELVRINYRSRSRNNPRQLSIIKDGTKYQLTN